MRCSFATESEARLSAGTRADIDPGVREVNVAKEDRGFASMDPNKQREIASKGGKAAHQKGTAHEWTSEEARNAGRKGGLASHRRRREQQGSAASESSEPGSGEWSGDAAGGGGSE
jgi:general stress protein YciG